MGGTKEISILKKNKVINLCQKSSLDKSVLHHFIQLNTDPIVYRALIALIDKSPCAAALFLYCAMRSSRYNQITLSLPEVCEKIGYQKRNVLYALQILEQYKFIRRTGNRGDHTYEINTLLVWKNSRQQLNIVINNGHVWTESIIIPETNEICNNISVNSFTQISATNKMLMILMELARKSPCGLKIALYMAIYCDNINRVIKTRKEIAELVGNTERSVSTAIALLSRYNILEAVRSGNHTTYYLNTEYTFKNKARNADNFKYVGALHTSATIFNDGIQEILKHRQQAVLIEDFTTLQNKTFQPTVKLPAVIYCNIDDRMSS